MDCPRPRLLPEAVPAAEAFMRVRTQWQYAPSGLPTGLRYADCMPLIQQIARRLGLELDQQDQLLEDLQVIEQAIVSAALEKRQREAAADGR